MFLWYADRRAIAARQSTAHDASDAAKLKHLLSPTSPKQPPSSPASAFIPAASTPAATETRRGRQRSSGCDDAADETAADGGDGSRAMSKSASASSLTLPNAHRQYIYMLTTSSRVSWATENARNESADNETARHEKARHENAGKVVFWFRSAWTVYTAALNFKSSRCRYLMNRNSTPRVAYSCRRTLSIWCRLRCINRQRNGRALDE